MIGSESYLVDAGWLFFAGWSLVVVTVTVIAFGKDFVTRFAKAPLLWHRQSVGPARNASVLKTHL